MADRMTAECLSEAKASESTLGGRERRRKWAQQGFWRRPAAPRRPGRMAERIFGAEGLQMFARRPEGSKNKGSAAAGDVRLPKGGLVVGRARFGGKGFRSTLGERKRRQK